MASFEPAYADELKVIMQWGFEHMQKPGQGRGGSVYLRYGPLRETSLRETSLRLHDAKLKTPKLRSL